MKYLAVCVLSIAMFPVNGYSETTKKDLVKACVNQKKQSYINSHASTVSKRGNVVCPSADIVGIPPRERRHNRDDNITLGAGEDRVFCDNPEVSYAVHSNSDGGQRNYSISSDRATITLPIYCRGSGLTQGRGWYDVTIYARSCPKVSEDQSLNFMLECAGAL
jgi:hypothetical protein